MLLLMPSAIRAPSREQKSLTSDGTVNDKYRTGSAPFTGRVVYQLELPTGLHFIAEVADALRTMTREDNWVQDGTVTVDEAIDAAVAMMRSFRPMTDQIPIGAVLIWAGETVPDGYLWCDNTTHLIDDYPDLFAVIGNNYGGNGTTDFKVPDMRARFPYGSTVLGDTGGTGGAATHTLTNGEMPLHNHNKNLSGNAERTLSEDTGGGTNAFATGGTRQVYSALQVTGNAGAGMPHNNMPPYITLNFIIRAE